METVHLILRSDGQPPAKTILPVDPMTRGYTGGRSCAEGHDQSCLSGLCRLSSKSTNKLRRLPHVISEQSEQSDHT